MNSTNDWQAPGPGLWERDAAHQERPFSSLSLELLGPRMGNAFARACARFGIPVSDFVVADVGGWMFASMVPIGEEAFPDYMSAAEAAVIERPWRAIVDEWERTIRADLLARNRAVQAVDVTSLNDAALASHLDEVCTLLEDGAERHFLQAAAHWVGVGLFAAATAELTGATPERAVQALAGASPASVAPVAALQRIAAAIAAVPAASQLLAADGDPRLTLDGLRSTSPAVAAALDAYLEEFGWQVFTGFDLTHEAIIELPGAFLATIRSVGNARHADRSALDALRADVPVAERERFETLLADAMAAYGIRDDDSAVTIHRPIGLLRRALLEAGLRLAARGVLLDPDDVFDIRRADLTPALTGIGHAGLASEVAARAARRRPPWSAPPRRIGEEDATPDGELPPAMAAVMGALLISMSLEDTAEEGAVGAELHGAAASAGVYEGIARVVDGPQDFERLREGDILVAPMTTPSYNVVLPLLGAVVTDRGGVLSHPAIVAREFGIPAVVGTGSATTSIRDGVRIRVDGTRGTVTILA